MLFFLTLWIHPGLWVIQEKTNEMGSSFKFPRFAESGQLPTIVMSQETEGEQPELSLAA